jgi:hypothetical protein
VEDDVLENKYSSSFEEELKEEFDNAEVMEDIDLKEEIVLSEIEPTAGVRDKPSSTRERPMSSAVYSRKRPDAGQKRKMESE